MANAIRLYGTWHARILQDDCITTITSGFSSNEISKVSTTQPILHKLRALLCDFATLLRGLPRFQRQSMLKIRMVNSIRCRSTQRQHTLIIPITYRARPSPSMPLIHAH